MRNTEQRRFRRGAMVAIALATALGASVLSPMAASASTPTSLFADPGAQSAIAARSDARLAGLAATPQGKWFSDWTSIASIRGDVAQYVAAAAAAHRMPVVVLYQIPGRDCGGYSSGGLASDANYRAWIDGAAAGVKGHPAIVVVEPDALAQLGNCTTPGDRVGMLRYAAQTMAAAGARVYLDAGHSNWQAPDVMAQRLVDAGIQYARGFSTNVANFQPTDAEAGYGTAVLTALATLGIGGKHFVIDTGRNGAGSTGEVCNPPSARVGTRPHLFGSGDLDAYLWVKTVGETDGACNGGPASGFSTNLALALVGDTLLAAPPVPKKPTAHRSGRGIVVKWKKSPTATGYRVTFTPKKGKAVVKIVAGRSYRFAKPKKKMTYRVTVAARNALGYSHRSPAVKVTTR